MSRIISALFALPLLALTASLSQAANSSEQPNILFIYVDDLGYEGLECYGGQDFSTPNLNKMADEGLRFSRAYASGVCTPSRVSMHTGLYSTRHQHTGVLQVHKGTDEKVDFEAMPTFTQQLRKAGYRTTVTGKWQLATLEQHPNHLRDAGYDTWCLWQIWRTNPLTGKGEKTTRYWNPTFNQDGAIREDIADRFGPDVLVDYVIEKMTEAVEANEPFLIVHNEMLPHYPMVQTPDDKAASPQRPAELGHMVHYMDKLVKRLLDAVETLGIRDNTYVVFMADNGTEERYFKNPRAGIDGELDHTRHTDAGPVNGGKFTVTDGGTHVPMIWWGPKAIQAGTVHDNLVDVVDIYPTFCELAAVPVSDTARLDGISLAPLLHGETSQTHRYTHGAVRDQQAVFDGQWRLKNTGELIDARQLPIELTIETETPESATARSRLEEILQSLQSE